MKNLRWWIYVPVGIVALYLTWQAISNTLVDSFDFGFIDFSREEVANYSNLLGALVGLLGVVLLVETLWLQYREFEKRDQKKLTEEKIESYYKLNLLQIDLSQAAKDLHSKSEKLKEYITAEEKAPFGGTVLVKSVIRDYRKAFETDRVAIYKGYRFYFEHRQNWLKEFNNTYSLLEFVPAAFNDIYLRYDLHAEDMFKRKTNIQDIAQGLLNEAAKVVERIDLRKESEKDENIKVILENVNNFIARYYNILKHNAKEENESDWQAISDEINIFLKIAVPLRKIDPVLYNTYLSSLVALGGDIRKEIYKVKRFGEQFLSSVQAVYDMMMVKSDDRESLYVQVSELAETLDQELSEIEVDNL